MRNIIYGTVILSSLCVVSDGYSAETTFGYSKLGLSVGNYSLDTSFDVDGVIYEELGSATVGGSYQFADNFFVGLSANVLNNSGGGTEFTDSSSALSLGAAFPVAPTADIGLLVAVLNDELEVCISNLCAKDEDDGYGLLVGMRAWATPSIAIGADYSTVNFGQGISGHAYTVGVSPYFGIYRNHSIDFTFTVDDETNTLFEIGYTYTFNTPQL